MVLFCGGLLLARMFVGFYGCLVMILRRSPAPAHPRFPSGTKAPLRTYVLVSPSTGTAEHLSRRHHVGSPLLYQPPWQVNSGQWVVLILLGAAGNDPARPNKLFLPVGRTLAASKGLKWTFQSDLTCLILPAGRYLAASDSLKWAFRSDLTSFFCPEVGLHPSERPRMRLFAPTQLAIQAPRSELSRGRQKKQDLKPLRVSDSGTQRRKHRKYPARNSSLDTRRR